MQLLIQIKKLYYTEKGVPLNFMNRNNTQNEKIE